MNKNAILLFVGLTLGTGSAQAFNFGNMMNPSDWFGNNHDHDRYYDRYYGGYGPYGWGGGPYGWGGPYGGGYGPYGGYGGYGWGGYPPAIVVNPSQSSGNSRPPPRPPE